MLNHLSLSSEDFLFFALKSYYSLIVVSVLCIGATIFFSKARKRSDIDGQIPGRLGLPFIGETFSFLSATNSTKGCYNFVELRRIWHGKWFKTRVLGKVHVFVPSTEGARKILSKDFVDFNKGYMKSMGDAVGKNSLLCVPHESHKRIRSLLSDPFSMDSLSNFVPKFDRILCQRLDELGQERKSFNVLDFCMKMTFNAICNMLMSVTDDERLRSIERDCVSVSDAMLSFPVMIPGTRYYKGIKARERLMENFKKMIAERRRRKDGPKDFLQAMLEKESLPASQKLDDSEILDNLLTMIVAGQTTTAAAMMWSVKFLDENKSAQDKLREEQLSIARNKPVDASLSLQDIYKMSYGAKVVKETLRMSNVILWFPRVVLNDCNIQGHEIKKGWHVNVDATCIHYDPDLYPQPMQFNPSRFDEMQKPYSFIPYGSGARTCLGMNMAKVTLLVFLHRLTSRYLWTVDDMDTSLEKGSHIPRLKSGCPITLKPL